MKYITILALSGLMLSSTALVAQRSTAIAIEQKDPLVQEMRVVAGGLKDVHQDLSEQLRIVTKLGESTDRIAAKRLVQLQGEIQEELAEVEGGLDRLSAADASAWATMKEEITALQERLSTSAALRRNGLKEAYGEK